MKKITFLFLGVFFIMSSLIGQAWMKNIQQNPSKQGQNFYEIQNEFYKYAQNLNADKTGHYYNDKGDYLSIPGWKQFKRWEYYWENRIDKQSGNFPQTTAWQEYQKYIDGSSSVKSMSGDWSNLGPDTTPGGYYGLGRLNCVAFRKDDNNTIYVGAPVGGVWKTIDGGSNWTPMADNNASIGVSDIVVVKGSSYYSDIIYIATGDKDHHDSYSVGVLKSVNGGSTWSTTGLTFDVGDNLLINRLLVDPNDNTILYAASTDGLYRTTDEGSSWIKIYSGSFVDMEFKPGSSDIMYASTRQGDIFRSTDAGFTWTQVLSTPQERTEIAVSEDDLSVVYAIVSNTNDGLHAIYKSTDSGATFSVVYSPSANLLGRHCDGSDLGGQAPYDLSIAVDPNDVNTIYIGGINTWKSIDGGLSWTLNNRWTSSCGSSEEVVHADKHCLAFQNGSSTLFECNDGGLYKTSDGGTNWTHLSNGMVIGQIYRIGVSQSTSNDIICGFQDNGTKNMNGSTWNDVIDGDGMDCAIDYTNADVQYGEGTYGSLHRTTNHWISKTDITGGLSDSASWIAPFYIDPNNHNTIYAAHQDVYKSVDNGDNWTKISNWNAHTLHSLTIAPSNSNYIYTATHNNLYRTTNGGTSWIDITGSIPVTNSNIRWISVKDNDPNTLWVALGGFNSEGVFQSTDGGATWTDISGGLPEVPVNCVIQNKLNLARVELYAATDVGVFMKYGTSDWQLFNHNLPNVVVDEVEIFYGTTASNSKIMAATYGRGLWESDLYTPPTATLSHSSTSDFNKGFLNNMNPYNGAVVMPYQANGFGSWASTSSLPQQLSGLKATTWDNHVYVSGGYNSSNGYSKAVYMANISTGISGWTALDSLPVGLRDHTFVSANGYLYVIGGRQDGLPSDNIYYASINANGTINAWQLASVHLPQALWGHTASYINGHILVVGGTHQASEGTATNSVYSITIKPNGDITSISTSVHPLPLTRNQHSAAIYGNKLYILGGYDNANQRQSTVYYCTVNNEGENTTWSLDNPLLYPVASHSSTCFNGIITVMGGYQSTDTVPSSLNYYATMDDAPSMNWSTFYPYPQYRANGDVFTVNGKIFYLGGEDVFPDILDDCFYTNLNLSTQKVRNGSYVSPVYDLGANRQIVNLSYTASGLGAYSLYYRMAENGGEWSEWFDSNHNNPLYLSQFKRYLQYMFVFESADINNNIKIEDISVEFIATQVCGTLSGTLHWTKANSPYLATCDLYLQSGTLTIDAGVEVLFAQETGFEIGHANLLCNGVIDDSIKFTSFDGSRGRWEGLYFNSDSDNGVASAMSYTVIEKAGFGDRDANLKCKSTIQPTFTHCEFRYADGEGVYLQNNSSPSFDYCTFKGNEKNGVYCYDYSNPLITNSSIRNNRKNGVNLNNSSPSIWNSRIIDNSQYAIHCTATSSFPHIDGNIYTGNTYDAVVYEGGTMYNKNGKYYSDGCEYIILGDITLKNSRLTIDAGVTCKFDTTVNIIFGYHTYSHTYYGELYANGTPDSLIVFTSLSGGVGSWDGLYFSSYNDYNGATSNINNCIVEKAKDYNIYCQSTTQPALINNCLIQNSSGDGIRLYNSEISLDNCSIVNNANYGVKCSSSSNSEFSNSVIANNGNHGFYLSSSPQIWGCVISNNSESAIYCTSPNYIPLVTGNTYTGNTYNAIMFEGGEMNIEKIWYADGCDYIALGDITVRYSRLTIKPGVTCKFNNSADLIVYGSNSGKFTAIGTADSLIHFTSFNDSIGGWNGISLYSTSDSYMKNCLIEKGNEFNLYCASISQPDTITDCSFNSALKNGIKLSSSNIVFDDCEFNNNEENGIRLNNSSPTILNSQISNNNQYAIYCASTNSFPVISGNTYSGNLYDAVVYEGGDMDYPGRWYADGCDYIVLNDLIVRNGAKLTINPGVNCRFDLNAGIKVGKSSSPGEIFAIGIPDSLITFTSILNNNNWEGVFFDSGSDNNGAKSSLKYCAIEKANQYNLYCYNTNQPDTITNCSFNNALQNGVKLSSSDVLFESCEFNNNGENGFYLSSSSPTIVNSQISNNGQYAIYSPSMYSFPIISGNAYSGNLYNAVVYEGGNMNNSGIWYADNCYYAVLSDITVRSNAYLTIKPGTTCKFDNNVELFIAGYNSGNLTANGTADSLIWFSSLNDSIGGWDGLYIHSTSDSYLKNCVVEKGEDYNLQLYNTNIQTIDSCVFSLSKKYGLVCSSTSPTITNSQFIFNGSDGIYITNNSHPTIGNTSGSGCDIYFNEGYGIYNNSSYDIDARYNYWNSTDDDYIASRIYDKYDNSSKGIVYFNDPLGSGQTLITDTYSMSGNITYDNTAQSIIDSVDVYAMDYMRNIVDTAWTDEFGHFEFNSIPYGKYLFDIEPQNNWGSVNSTDALLIMQHFAQVNTLSDIRRDASDVNWSHTVNATDALLVMKRFTAMINSFPAGDWLLELDSLVIDGRANLTHDFKALCYGDVNGSYIPLTKQEGSLSLVFDGVQMINSYQEFDLSINVTEYMNVGAISLILYYPEQYLEVLNVNNEAGNVIWTASEGKIQISWASLEAMELSKGESLINLHLISKDISTLTDPIEIGLDTSSELADGEAIVIEDAVLSTSSLATTYVGVDDSNNTKGYYINNYPNPFTGKTLIQYAILDAGKVKLTVFDILGNPVKVLIEENQSTGNHSFLYEDKDLSSGVYFYTLEVVSKDKHYAKTRRMVKTR